MSIDAWRSAENFSCGWIPMRQALLLEYCIERQPKAHENAMRLVGLMPPAVVGQSIRRWRSIALGEDDAAAVAGLSRE